MLGFDVFSIIWAIALFDAAAVFVMGVIIALLTLFNVKQNAFFERLGPATTALVLSSLGCAGILYAAHVALT